MIKKEDFTKAITAMKNEVDYTREVEDIGEKYGRNDFIEYSPLLDVCVELLSKEVELETPNFLERWMFEKDFGREYKPGDITYTDTGKNIEQDLTTIDGLYDFLVAEKKEEDKK